MSVAIDRTTADDKAQFDAEFDAATADVEPPEPARADECDWMTGTCWWTNDFPT